MTQVIVAATQDMAERARSKMNMDEHADACGFFGATLCRRWDRVVLVNIGNSYNLPLHDRDRIGFWSTKVRDLSVDGAFDVINLIE